MNFKFSDWALVIAVLVGCLLLIIASVLHVRNNCEEGSYYEVLEWSECQPGGVKTRVVTALENPTCKSSRKPARPVDTEHCNYTRPCEEIDYTLDAWNICIDGKQNRKVRLKEDVQCIENSKPQEEKSCSVQNKILLLKNYTTEVDPTDENPYSPSYRNITIVPHGEFEELKLHVAADTSVLGGEAIQVPEYYYFLFSMGEGVARALGTSRNSDSRLDLNDFGVFKGTQMPIEQTFDLTEAKLAKASNEISGPNTPIKLIHTCKKIMKIKNFIKPF